MSAVESSAPPLNELLERMVANRQLSAGDMRALTTHAGGIGNAPVRSEEEVLRWLATEYGLAFTALEDVEPDKEGLSLFPARILLKDASPPLGRATGTVETATSKLSAPRGLDTLRSMTALPLKPV